MDRTLEHLENSLNRDGVQLWTAEFTGSDGRYSEDFVAKYRNELNVDAESLVSCLEQLRFKSIEDQNEFKEVEPVVIANLTARIISQRLPRPQIILEIPLSNSGLNLKQQIAAQLQAPVEFLRVVFSGLLVEDSEILSEQGLADRSSILVFNLTDAPEERGWLRWLPNNWFSSSKQTARAEELAHFESHLETLQGTLAATVFYSESFELANQSGEILTIPKEEMQALSLALSVHNLGAEALRNRDYPSAIAFFFEAESLYLSCNSDLLSVVDNFGILCLDIVWSYLHLRVMENMPDAASLLEKSEAILRRSYGSDMERLKALKGDATNELALFARLFLLQGIDAFNRKDFEESKALFDKSNTLLTAMKVDHDSLALITELGYSAAEARLALRATRGDVETSVQQIASERERIGNMYRQERQQDRQKARLVLEAVEVNAERLEELISMGFEEHLAQHALRYFDNDVEQAAEALDSAQREDSEGEKSQHWDNLSLPQHLHEHLDLTLEDEESFIQDFSSRLPSIPA